MKIFYIVIYQLLASIQLADLHVFSVLGLYFKMTQFKLHSVHTADGICMPLSETHRWTLFNLKDSRTATFLLLLLYSTGHTAQH